MKKTKKGLTLVEVLVSVAVFAVIMLALTSTYIGMRNLSRRQEQYVRLEMVCYDINYYWDAYGEDKANTEQDWSYKYSGKYADDNLILLNADFKPISSGTPTYTIKYSINEDNELIIESVKTRVGDRVYIKNLNCGKKGE